MAVTNAGTLDSGVAESVRYEGSTEIVIEDPQNTSGDQGETKTEQTKPQADKQPSAAQVGQAVDLSKVDRSVIMDFLSKDEEFRKEVAKTVRTKDVETKAEARARELSQGQIEALRTELNLTKGQFNSLVDEIKKAQRAAMPEGQRKLAEMQDEIQTERQRAQALQKQVEATEDDREKAKLLQSAKVDWGLEDDDVEKLAETTNAAQFVKLALDLSAKRRKALMAELEVFRAKGQAAARTESGQSAYAATASSASGSEMSYEDLQQHFIDDPDEYGERYREARLKRGEY